MSDWPFILLGGVGLLGFYLVLGWLTRRQNATFAGGADKWFAELRRHGWRITPGNEPQEFIIEHVLHNIPVMYSQKYALTGAGDNERWTIARNASATIAAPIGDLTLLPEGMLRRAGKMLGAQDIDLGDAAFDAAFVLKCADPDVARRALTPAARQALLAARGYLGDALSLREGKVFWDGTNAAPGLTVEQIADLLARTAAVIGR